jgi:hypothetical protein
LPAALISKPTSWGPVTVNRIGASAVPGLTSVMRPLMEAAP